jgi:hypothetical protein
MKTDYHDDKGRGEHNWTARIYFAKHIARRNIAQTWTIISHSGLSSSRPLFAHWLYFEKSTTFRKPHLFSSSSKSQDSSVGIANGWGSITGRGKIFFFILVQTGSEAHSASCRMGTGNCFPGAKTAGAWSRLPTSHLHSPTRLHGVVLN